jgi:hypothetical protein
MVLPGRCFTLLCLGKEQTTRKPTRDFAFTHVKGLGLALEVVKRAPNAESTVYLGCHVLGQFRRIGPAAAARAFRKAFEELERQLAPSVPNGGVKAHGKKLES